MDEPLAYLNGSMIPASQAALPVYDSGVVLGTSVTELVRTFDHRLYRFDQHLDRLARSMQSVGLSTAIGRDELVRIAGELVEHNGPLLDRGQELGLVVFVTAGDYPTYAGMSGRPLSSGTLCLHTFRLPFELWAGKVREGVHLVTPEVRQVPAACWDPRIKCRSRMHYYLAGREASRVDPQAWALLMDLEGNLTETNGANFLLVEGQTIVSPPSSTILPGISRGVLLELAQSQVMRVAERQLRLHDAAQADEALLTSTPFCLLAVTRLNGAPIGGGAPGPVYRRLLEAWSREVGLDIEQQILDCAR